MVIFFFFVIGENCLYFCNDFLIICVMFNLGDIIISYEGWQFYVDKVNEENGLLFYIGICLDIQEVNVILCEVLFDSKLVFSKLQDCLFVG